MRIDFTQASGQVWQVSDLNREVRSLLESGFGTVWVEAEISNLARPASGHLYFSLKDPSAQLRAAFFRQRQRGSVRGLANGDQVLVRGRLSLYEPRGDYQLIVEHLEPAGEGALRRAFELLKRKLADEGLFADSLKQALPTLPSRIGVITSPSGAAVQDVLKVLRRRMPSIPVRIYPASVQGAEAPAALRDALQRASAQGACDVLLLVRGGGSIEDLAAFNDEALARLIVDCKIPVITGVGHETDTTIVDFVADKAAPTPSAAAEIATPDGAALRGQLSTLQRRLTNAQQRRHHADAQRLDFLARRLGLAGPSARLKMQSERLNVARQRLPQSLRQLVAQRRQRVAVLVAQLIAQQPGVRVRAQRRRLEHATVLLRTAQSQRLERLRTRLSVVATHLNAISPLATLERGYAIVRDEHGTALHRAEQVRTGSKAEVLMSGGRFEATVSRVVSSETDD
ncbi:MAG: exodeoxyribonuclease VII large subunit [Pseudomonadota bacterium]